MRFRVALQPEGLPLVALVALSFGLKPASALPWPRSEGHCELVCGLLPKTAQKTAKIKGCDVRLRSGNSIAYKPNSLSIGSGKLFA